MASGLRHEGEPLSNPFITLPDKDDREWLNLLNQIDSHFQSELPPNSIGLTPEFIRLQPVIYRARIIRELIDTGRVDVAALSKKVNKELGNFFNEDAFDIACAFIDEYTKSKKTLLEKLASISS